MNEDNIQPSESSDPGDAGESQLYPLHIRQEDGTDKLVDFQGKLVDEDGVWAAFLGDDDRVILWNRGTHMHKEHDLESAQGLPRFPKLQSAVRDREDERSRGEGP